MKEDFIKYELYDYILENSTARYPLAEYNKQLQNLEDMAESFEEENNYSIDEYLQTVFGKTRDEYVKHTLKTSMLYYAIAQAEKIEPSKAQLDAEKNELIAYYYEYYISKNYAQSEAEKTANELVNDLGNAYVYEQVIIELVKKHMVDIAKVSYTEKTYTSISEASNN